MHQSLDRDQTSLTKHNSRLSGISTKVIVKAGIVTEEEV